MNKSNLNNTNNMVKLTKHICLMLICTLACLNGHAEIDPPIVQSIIQSLTAKDGKNKEAIEKGVRQCSTRSIS